MFSLKNWIGILLNDLFVNVTKKNLNNFYILIFFTLFGSFIPFLFIKKMIPSR
jgi:hypothetical protein